MILVCFFIPFLLPKCSFLQLSFLLVKVIPENRRWEVLKVRMAVSNLSGFPVGCFTSLHHFLESLLCRMLVPIFVSSLRCRIPGKLFFVLFHSGFVKQNASAIQFHCCLEIGEVHFEPSDWIFLEVFIGCMDLLRSTDMNPRRFIQQETAKFCFGLALDPWRQRRLICIRIHCWSHPWVAGCAGR